MITISLCMIVKNEEATLARCLKSVEGIVNEIIIVDTGSTDRTKEIARAFTEHVYDFLWIDDFSAARNEAFSKASMEYILWLDADDILKKRDHAEFLKLKETLDPDVDLVMMRYHTMFDEQGNPTFLYYRERLLKRAREPKWMEPVHEYIFMPGAKTVNAPQIAITHAKVDQQRSTGRNMRIYEAQIASGKMLSPRGMYYYARELMDNGRHEAAATQFEAFLSGGRGWVEDNIASCGALANCYRHLDRQDDALLALFRSFRYDTPRAELCCKIGYHFKNQGRYDLAVYWFKMILELTRPVDSWGFIEEDCWEFIPCVELAVCFDAIGDIQRANAFNERAALTKPKSEAVLHNRHYFQQRLKQTDE